MEYEKNTKEIEHVEMTNEEYRKELMNLFSKIEENKKLKFWYKYISAIEKG